MLDGCLTLRKAAIERTSATVRKNFYKSLTVRIMSCMQMAELHTSTWMRVWELLVNEEGLFQGPAECGPPPEYVVLSRLKRPHEGIGRPGVCVRNSHPTPDVVEADLAQAVPILQQVVQQTMALREEVELEDHEPEEMKEPAQGQSRKLAILHPARRSQYNRQIWTPREPSERGYSERRFDMNHGLSLPSWNSRASARGKILV